MRWASLALCLFASAAQAGSCETPSCALIVYMSVGGDGPRPVLRHMSQEWCYRLAFNLSNALIGAVGQDLTIHPALAMCVPDRGASDDALFEGMSHLTK